MEGYWGERAAKAQDTFTSKGIKKTEAELMKSYRTLILKIQGQFVSTYNHLLLSIEEEREPTPADLYKLDKYWQMQAQLQKTLEKMGDKQIHLLTEAFKNQYKGIYGLALPSEVSFSTVQNEAAEQVLKSIWCADGKSWSERVWFNISKLQEDLNTNLLECVVTGKTPAQLKQLLMKQFEVGFGRADTIVRTEMAHIQTEAAKQRYIDNGIKEVMVWASEDERRCPQCGKLHEKVFPAFGAMPVPVHPNCRCCIVPVVEN